MDDLALMRLRADTSFTYTHDGRMLLTNEPRVPDRRPAPLVWLGYMPGGTVLRFGAALPDGLVGQVTQAVERVPANLREHEAGAEQNDGLPRIPVSLLAAVRSALAENAPPLTQGGGPAYRFPDVLPVPARAVALTAANRAYLAATFPWLHDELADWQPSFAVVRDGAAVSVCFSARLSDGAAEAGVETLPDFRGHGYAGMVSTAWAAAIRATGRTPFYSTSWENLASRTVARRLGLLPFGSDAHWS